jgi:hypothetical protein
MWVAPGHDLRQEFRLSKKLINLEASVAIFMAFYNFCRVHQTLRVTPAMEGGLADRVWTVLDLLMADIRATAGEAFLYRRLETPPELTVQVISGWTLPFRSRSTASEHWKWICSAPTRGSPWNWTVRSTLLIRRVPP